MIILIGTGIPWFRRAGRKICHGLAAGTTACRKSRLTSHNWCRQRWTRVPAGRMAASGGEAHSPGFVAANAFRSRLPNGGFRNFVQLPLYGAEVPHPAVVPCERFPDCVFPLWIVIAAMRTGPADCLDGCLESGDCIRQVAEQFVP